MSDECVLQGAQTNATGTPHFLSQWPCLLPSSHLWPFDFSLLSFFIRGSLRATPGSSMSVVGQTEVLCHTFSQRPFEDRLVSLVGAAAICLASLGKGQEMEVNMQTLPN